MEHLFGPSNDSHCVGTSLRLLHLLLVAQSNRAVACRSEASASDCIGIMDLYFQ
jgi:hypothetical protein